ncbi:MAG: glycosyltransferase family 2 protein, partial [Armatimonadota bacterium]|nr:glycosyltransferase family 2 protein [Armatimonadota bacterium]
MWDWVLLLSLTIVAYTYFGYPALLLAWGRWRPSHTPRERLSPDGYQPFVSVVIAAYNERRNIERRLHNLLVSDYPRERMEIIVVCDGCTDETAKLAAQFDGVRVVELAKRRGKSAALNVGVQLARGEIIVFADARPLFAADTISRLVRVLEDPKVGAVSGELILMAEDGTPRALGLYWRYEKVLRALETRVDSIVVCTGAVYAIRKDLFVPIPEGLAVDDMWVPLHIARQGYRVVFHREAHAY